jgi:hypothetical protein
MEILSPNIALLLVLGTIMLIIRLIGSVFKNALHYQLPLLAKTSNVFSIVLVLNGLIPLAPIEFAPLVARMMQQLKVTDIMIREHAFSHVLTLILDKS